MDSRPNPNEKNARIGERLPHSMFPRHCERCTGGRGMGLRLIYAGLFSGRLCSCQSGRSVCSCGFSLPDSHPSICVSVAVVRWAQGRRFGVEFMRVDDKYRAHLNRFITLQPDPWPGLTIRSARHFAVQLSGNSQRVLAGVYEGGRHSSSFNQTFSGQMAFL